MLHYYRNGVVHLFILESIVSLVLTAQGPLIAFEEGISIEKLWGECEFLFNLFD